MTIRSSLSFTLLVLASACAAKPAIVGADVSRSPIVFESDEGMAAFDEALRERWDDGKADVPGERARLSLSAYFNREVDRADLDRDGFISDREATSYGN